MRSRILPVVGLSVAALALATTVAPTANASHDALAPVHSTTGKVGPLKVDPSTCYSQSGTDAGNAALSQDFESQYDAYDSQSADDFQLTSTCTVSTITAVGQYFNGSGPARSFNVYIYKWKKSTVKKAKVTALEQSYSYDGNIPGSFVITLDKPVKLKKGMYWLSVQANLDFSAGGEWGWQLSSDIQYDPAVFQNPGNGFGSGCTKYADLGTCLGLGSSYDLMFSIN